MPFGTLGSATLLGSVAIGSIILSTLYWLFGFPRMSTSGLTAQSRGAQDSAETSAILLRALIIAGTAGLTLILLQAPLFWAAFRLCL